MVVAAGNRQSHLREVAHSIPQKLADPTDTMIIVGAVGKDGTMWDGSVEDPSGSITVFAPGKDISLPAGMMDRDVVHGTSPAAAIVVRETTGFQCHS